MEQENILQEILSVLKQHSNRVDSQFHEMNTRLDRLELNVNETNERLDRVEKKMVEFV